MAGHWTSALSLLFVSLLFLYDEWISTPSCTLMPNTTHHLHEQTSQNVEDPDDLRVMIVANLLLLGSNSTLVDTYFRDYYMSKFFRKSVQTLNPDMLLVLGDISAQGLEMTKSEWISVLHQFHHLVGPLIDLPYHVLLGDRDIGECSRLNVRLINWISRNFPGLDSAGCGAFEISNITFVSLNTVALLCGNAGLRFSVEKVIERESLDYRMETEEPIEVIDEFHETTEMFSNMAWRVNSMPSGSGPVLLLHFPLHRSANTHCRGGIFNERKYDYSEVVASKFRSRKLAERAPYGLSHTLPHNATEYIVQALKPKVVFSAQGFEFCDYAHKDGTREVSVPPMSWNARDDPGFLLATFRFGTLASIEYCSIARESHVMLYVFVLTLLMSITVLAKCSSIRSSRPH